VIAEGRGALDAPLPDYPHNWLSRPEVGMSEDAAITAQDVVEINPTFLFRWEEQEQAYLLLYPEGIIKLNTAAGEILKLCTGEHSVAEIVRELDKKFQDEDLKLEKEVHKFLEASLDNGWIRRTT
jgi:pyrroloquinoline quinone biosynthesis protein D